MLAGSIFRTGLGLGFLTRTWTWTCPLNVDLDLTVAGLVTSLVAMFHKI